MASELERLLRESLFSRCLDTIPARKTTFQQLATSFVSNLSPYFAVQ